MYSIVRYNHIEIEYQMKKEASLPTIKDMYNCTR